MTPSPRADSGPKKARLSPDMRSAQALLKDRWEPVPGCVRNGTARALAARGLAEIRVDTTRRALELEWRRPALPAQPDVDRVA